MQLLRVDTRLMAYNQSDSLLISKKHCTPPPFSFLLFYGQKSRGKRNVTRVSAKSEVSEWGIVGLKVKWGPYAIIHNI